MRKPSLTLLAAALAGSALGAQDAKVTADLCIYYTQMLDSNLRLNTPSGTLAAGTGSGSYYPLRGDFRENGFSIRRAEVYLNGKIIDELTYNVMFDVNTATSTTATPGSTQLPTILFDAFMLWKPNPNIEVKLGQYKPPTSYEATLVGSPSLYFYDRSMMNRQIADRRDRGITASYLFGNPKELAAKLSVGFFNGSADRDFGRANDQNAQKDFAFRLEMNYGADHKFGFYSKQGTTDQADKGGLTVGTFLGAPNTDPAFKASVIDNKDKTTMTGAYYVYETSKWHASAEVMTGLLGRRWASIGVTAALRQHLDQKFLGYTLTGVYKMGKHQLTARYDFMNYNKGDDWYTSYNPYTQTSTGASLGADYTPKYTEVVLGYNYLWNPAKYSHGQVKLNYIHRSKNFLLPNTGAGQTGEQGGDSLMAVFQIGF